MNNRVLTEFGRENKQGLFFLLSTITCLVTLISVGTFKEINEKEIQYSGNDKGRNERSTPRSFILPATPAVALEQERKLFLREKEVQIKYCMLKLHDLGYKIVNFEDIFDIHISIGIMDFQKKEGLSISGELDTETIAKLGCNL